MEKFEPGDILKRTKGVVIHKGVAISDNRVFHNTPDKGEHISTLAEFTKGKNFRVAKRPKSLKFVTMVRINDSLTKRRKYSLLLNNCEHSVTRVIDGKPYSNQLKLGVSILAGVCILNALKNKN